MIALEDKLEGRKRGFAAMHPDKQREIASKGGRSVPADARAFAKDRQLAKAAGSKSLKQRTPPTYWGHSSSGCGQSRAVAGWPRSPGRPSATRLI